MTTGERRRPMEAALQRLAQACGATVLALGLEWVTVSRLAQRYLTSSWEIKYGTLCLLPSLVLLAPVTIAAAACWALLERSARDPRARTGLAVLGAAFAALSAFSVSYGRHFADPRARAGFVAIVAALGAGLAIVVSPRIARGIVRSPRVTGALVFGTGLVLELANRFVLVRLYPGFHFSLAALVLLLAPGLKYGIVALTGGAIEVPRRLRRVLPAIVLVAVYGACAVLWTSSTKRLSRLDNFRLMLVEQSPLLGRVIEIDAALLPPEAEPSASACSGEQCTETTPRSASRLDWVGRDILLITIDALRADHVGSYGYARSTTPAIDALAASAVVFDAAYCPTPHTSYSVTSLLTGKYMRPLLLQGLGADSPTLADILRTYGYKTAAFYPPAVFFIDSDRFKSFETSGLGFEYRKVEFNEGEGRIRQVRDFLGHAAPGQPLFLWVHLFGPHEPYELHAEHDFGLRDVDRYDSEIAAADASVGAMVASFRERSPSSIVIVSADHGEEFGDHGGHYHGSSVYEEQVRVPLIVSIPGATKTGRVRSPVQTIDLMPTLLGALKIPISPRVRGRDLSALLSAPEEPADGFAFAETDEMTLIAERRLRLVCRRKLGACALFDLEQDPTEQRDTSATQPEVAARLRADLHRINATHGEYERLGQGSGGASLPSPILRGLAGDADAAEDIIPLLDDANVELRRKAAELLFRLKARSAGAALHLALGRDDDVVVQRYAALALTRFGDRVPLVFDLLNGSDRNFRRLAALVLAETGDDRGRKELTAWWQDDRGRDFETSRDLLGAFAAIRCKDAVPLLAQSLDDVRLRPYVARALGDIGDGGARGALLQAFRNERYQGARVALADALVRLGATSELTEPLRRFLGVPDPLTGGLGLAIQAGVLESIGGPGGDQLKRLTANAASGSGEQIHLTIPPGGNGRGVRIIARAKNTAGSPKVTHISIENGLINHIKSNDSSIQNLGINSDLNIVEISFPPSPDPQEIAVLAPDSLGLRPGQSLNLEVRAEQGLELEGLAILPLSDELPPPPPEPWQPRGSADGENP